MTEEEIPEDKPSVFKFLLETGCCKRCCMRFIGSADTDFDNPESYSKKFFNNSSENDDEVQISKKSKSNPCIICLDLLHDDILNSLTSHPHLEDVTKYDSDTFVNFISYPTSVLLREHSMEIFVREKFPKFFEDRNICPINRAWSCSIQNPLGQKLKKRFDKNSFLQIKFTTGYEFESEETSAMAHLTTNLKKPNGKHDPFSRNTICDSLKTIEAEFFKKYVSVPPQTPSKSVIVEEISCKHEYIYIAGRYCKFSRDLFQTPWLDEEGGVVRGSVQDVIFQALENIFNCSSLIFSSSGREDFDVRTLGRGRPFFIKICDPKTTKVSSETFRLVEKTIQKSNVVSVRDLQFIDRKHVNNIKDGEQFKKKSYRALCIVQKPENLLDYVQKINTASSVTIQQKTPLRVYHRRSADVREREIYSLEAKPITGKDNLFELDMVTQAGTYVKEFVHGDLGRTKPSLSDIIGGDVDIIALDVLDIHLDFPPPLT